MLTSDFDYALPEELIAQEPPSHRTDSRMMLVDAAAGSFEIRPFKDVVTLLRPGDCLAVNNTRVIKARLFAQRPSGAKLEILLLSKTSADGLWKCFLKPGKRAKPGMKLPLLASAGGESPFEIEVVEHKPEGDFVVRLDPVKADEAIARCGHMPLPPYIKRSDAPADAERYQTVYAKAPGSVAAPTAGLHFDSDTLNELKELGVKRAELTLHVGAGTFKPVSADKIEDHKMHSEEFSLSQETCELLNSTRSAGGRVMAVGTTTLRVLESCVDAERRFSPRSGSTEIFIHPPMRPQAADLLLTNFHLPKSTLLMLVCAFAGSRKLVLDAYAAAVKERMRFFSYGDCMLLKRS